MKIESKRASFSEASASSAVAQLNIANERIEELKIEVETSNRDVISSRTNAERAIASDKEELHSEITILKKKIFQLEALNAEIASRSGNMIELYKERKLVRLMSTQDRNSTTKCFRLMLKNSLSLISSKRHKHSRRKQWLRKITN